MLGGYDIFAKSRDNVVKSYGIFFYVLFALICFYPYEFYSVYLTFLPEQSLYTALIILVSTLFILFPIRTSRVPRVLYLVAFGQLLGYFITSYVHGNMVQAMPDHCLRVLLAVVLVVFICNHDSLKSFFIHYNKWILLMALMGVVTFILVYFFHFKPFSEVIDRADGRIIENYLLTFSKSTHSLDFLIFKFAGFFDESGAMANWGLFALLINKLFIKSKRVEWLLIISLLFTGSFGYYVQILVYLVLFHFRIPKLGVIAPMSLMVLLIVLIYNTRDTDNQDIYDATFGRVEEAFIEGKTSGDYLSIDSREVLTVDAREEFLKHPLFGTNTEGIGNNIYETLAMYGLVGAPLVLLPFLLLLIWSFKYRDTVLLRCVLVILIGFAHRPFHPNILSFFIAYCIVAMYWERIQTKRLR